MPTPTTFGPETLVNTTTKGAQIYPQVAPLDDGGWVVVWQDEHLFGNYEVYAQAYNADGTPRGGEVLVNSSSTGQQQNPAVAGLEGGGFVVTWTDTGGSLGDVGGIHGQAYGATGAPVGGPFLVNSTLAGSQSQSSTAALAGGGFVVTWQDGSATGGDTSGTAIRAQMFDAAGTPVGSEFLVNVFTTAGPQSEPAVAGLEGGGFVVAWTSVDTVGSEQLGRIHYQVYDASGARLGGERVIASGAGLNDVSPEIDALEGGGFAITWARGQNVPAPENYDYDIWARTFTATGAPATPPKQVNVVDNQDFQATNDIAGLPDGGYVVVWRDSSTSGTAQELDVKARVYNADGTARSGEFLVDTTNASFQSHPTVEALPDSRFVITWQDSDGTMGDTLVSAIHSQVFDPRLTGVTLIGDSGTDTWVGSRFADRLNGSAGNDGLRGEGGTDSLLGGGGNDSLNGGAGNDTMDGGGNIDRLVGGSGNDLIDGGAARDTLTGALGDDTFRFLAPGDGDVLTDFGAVAGNNDRIQVSAAGFGGGLVAGGALAASQLQVRADNLAQDGNDRFIFRTTDATLWFDVNGSAAGGLSLVADLQAGAVLTAADIVLI